MVLFKPARSRVVRFLSNREKGKKEEKKGGERLRVGREEEKRERCNVIL